MSTNLSPIQKVLLETFKAFVSFCEEQNLKYYAAYGTLLGAIRHKGFIPWDDDIDVFMLREDYNKFITLKKDIANRGIYRIANFRDKGFPYSFAKFYDSSKTFWEYPHFPFVIGPFIDVFPLDEWDDKDNEMDRFYDYQHKIYWKYRKSISHQTWREIISDIIHFNGYEGPVKLIKKLFFAPRYRYFLKQIDKIECMMSNLKGPYLNDYSYIKSKKFEKTWFQNSIEVSFEDTTITAPEGYDECLKVSYGNYMKLPDVQSRTGHHLYYMNLEKRMTIKEIMREKNAELSNKKKMGFKVLWNEIKHRKGF